MNEYETEKTIDRMIDFIIKVLMKNDFRGILIAEMEKYDENTFYELPPKAKLETMKRELDNIFDKIFEIRKLAENLYNLDVKNEIFEMTVELEEDWAKVYKNVNAENVDAYAVPERIYADIVTPEYGGAANVFDWA